MAELMDAAIHLYRSHLSSFLLIALIVNLPLMVISFLDDASALEELIAFREASAYDPLNPTFTSLPILVVIASLATSIFVPWMDGALAHQTLERLLGRSPTWRESYRIARPYWGALWLSMFIKGLAIVGVFLGLGLCSSVTAAVFGGGGFIVTLVLALAPGLLLALNWVFSTQAIVFENATATGALIRSSALMRGSRGLMLVRVGGFGLIWLFFAVVLPFAFSLFIGRMGFNEPDVYAAPLALLRAVAPSLLNALALLLVGPMFGIYVTLNYLDLRIRKDNLDLQLRAQALAP